MTITERLAGPWDRRKRRVVDDPVLDDADGTGPPEPEAPAPEDLRPGPEATTNEELDELLRKLSCFLLRNSSEGTFDVAGTVRSVAQVFDAQASVLLMMEGMSLVITHADGTQRSLIVHAQPNLERLDVLSEFKILVGQIDGGQLSARQALVRLDVLQHQHHRYPLWLRFIGVVLFAAGFAPSMQATWRELWLAMALGAVAAVVVLTGERVNMLRIMLPLLVATVVSIVGFSLFHVRLDHGGPVLVMIPALFLMIPGDYMCAAATELAIGQFTVGTIRLAQSFFVLLQLAAGVVIGAELSGAGTHSLIAASTVSDLPWELVALAWIPFTIGLTLTFSVRPRDVGWILFGVYLAWGVQLLVSYAFGVEAGTFVAAAVLALVGTLFGSHPDRPPTLVIILGGVFVLTVGSMALRGLTTLEGGHILESFHDMLTFANIAGALTFGLIVGTGIALAILRRSMASVADLQDELR